MVNEKYDNILGTTKIIGIIGDPIEHTLSPIMHNSAIHDLKLNYAYIPFHVFPNSLKNAIEGLKSLNVHGFNVTVPHKVSIMQYLDKIDEKAIQIGAVNTVKNIAGNFIGKNTDGEGCIQAILDTGFKLKGKIGIIIGAGGAARSIAFQLVDYLDELIIINRSADTLANLTTSLKKHSDILIKGITISNTEEIQQSLNRTDLLINTSSLGMYPNIDQSPISPSLLNENVFVNDIVYSPIETKLIKEAKKKGCKTLSGIEMLINQGSLAFEWWTGHIPNKKVMKIAIEPYIFDN